MNGPIMYQLPSKTHLNQFKKYMQPLTNCRKKKSLPIALEKDNAWGVSIISRNGFIIYYLLNFLRALRHKVSCSYKYLTKVNMIKQIKVSAMKLII